MTTGRPDLKAAAVKATAGLSHDDVLELTGAPTIVLSAPRSGSTLLFELMVDTGPYWTVGGESHVVFNGFPELRAENPQLDSMALNESHAEPETADLYRRCFLCLLRNSSNAPLLSQSSEVLAGGIQILEKTPRNALNIPFLTKVFPNARFIYLRRDPKQTISSLIEAWTLGLQTGRFVTFRNLPDWHLPAWCFLLPRGWRDLQGKSLPEIAAFQWAASNKAIIEGLGGLPKDRWTSLDYDDLIADPVSILQSLGDTLGVGFDAAKLPGAGLPLSRTTISQPAKDKWKRHTAELESVRPLTDQMQIEIDVFVGH